MYQTITGGDSIVFDRRLNAAEKEGFAPVAFSTLAYGKEFLYSVVMHKPGTTPEPHMTAEQYLAVRSQVSCDKTANTVLKHLRLKGLVKDGAAEKAKAAIENALLECATTQNEKPKSTMEVKINGRKIPYIEMDAEIAIKKLLREEARQHGACQ